MTGPIEKIQELAKNLEGLVMAIVNDHSGRMVRVMVQEHMSGQSANSVGRRSGNLARSVEVIPATSSGFSISGGLRMGGSAAKYANVHVGPQGSVMTITPKSKQFLTIPLPAAKTGAGVARAPATSSIWGPTFIAKGVIFQKGSKGSAPTPLFVLKRSVTVPRRIFPADLVAKIKPQFVADLQQLAKGG